MKQSKINALALKSNTRIEIDKNDYIELTAMVTKLQDVLSRVKITDSGIRENRVPFSAKEKDDILRLMTAGNNVYSIAKELGRPFNSVKNFIRKNNA